jgi:hypothetical protein
MKTGINYGHGQFYCKTNRPELLYRSQLFVDGKLFFLVKA